MPGERYERGGVLRGLSDLFAETREIAADSMRAAIQFGKAVERRGSTLPLLRRMSRHGSGSTSIGAGRAEYESIPLERPGSVSPSPFGNRGSQV
jgi:hypothetical protein